MYSLANKSVNPREVFDKETVQELLKKNKDGSMTLQEIKELSYNTLKAFYSKLFGAVVEEANKRTGNNDTLESFVGVILTREIVEETLEKVAKDDKNAYTCFSCLKGRRMVEVCGSGYIFVTDNI